MSDQPQVEAHGRADIRDDPSSPTWPLVVLVVLAAVGAMWLLLYPLNFDPLKVTDFLSERRIPRINTLSNVLLFTPLGVMLGWLAWRKHMWLAGVVAAVVLASLLSLLGEWLQMWLPDRQSSLTDVLANVAGAAIGAAMLRVVVRLLDSRYSAVVAWLAPRPAMCWTALTLLLILAAKAAPFDVSVETFYIRQTLYQTRDAGLPFNKVWHWLNAGAARPPLWSDAAARHELFAAGANAILMGVATLVFALAIRESLLRGHDRTNPAPYALILGCIFAIVAEASQGLVRSRVMDATDMAAGLNGVIVAAVGVGCVMALTTWRRRHR